MTAACVRLSSAALTVLLVLTVAGPTVYAHSVDTSQRAILDKLKAAFSSLAPMWTKADYCDWKGVKCDASRYIVKLKLDETGLVGNLASKGLGSILANSTITSLDLSDNPGLTGTFPSDWTAIKTLQEIDVSHTGLSGAIPESWGNMPSIQKIQADHTQACGGLPNWGASSRLQRINLGDNPMMHGTLAASWAQIPLLKQVHIERNKFCGCLPSSWSSSSILKLAASNANSPALNSPTCATSNACSPSANDGSCAQNPDPGHSSNDSPNGNPGTNLPTASSSAVTGPLRILLGATTAVGVFVTLLLL